MEHHRITPIDLDLLQTIAKRSGVDDQTNPDSVWSRLFTRSDFVQQLHVSLYGLILGILDDLFLGHLRVQILSDDNVFELVHPTTTATHTKKMPSPKPLKDSVAVPLSNSSSSSTMPSTKSVTTRSLTLASSSFVAGMGVGVTLVTLLSRSQR